MKSKIAFTKKDFVIAVGCAVFLLLSIGGIGGTGRERAKRAVCLTNLRQLTLAWNVYADDNDNKIVNGETYSGVDGMAFVPTGGRHARELWWTGDDIGDFWTGMSLPLDLQLKAIRAGALWPYSQDVKLYRCPSGHPGQIRNYSIVDSMNGLPRSGTYVGNVGRRVGETVLWIKKRTEIITPGPAFRVVFVDEGRVTADSYGVHYENERWWDPPSVRHGEGAPLSFADGHSEYCKWQGRKTIEIGKLAAVPGRTARDLHQMVPESPEDFQDLYEMQKGVWGRLGYTASHQ